MSIEGRQQGANLWTSLGNEYIGGLTGVRPGFGYESSVWSTVGEINRDSRRRIAQIQRDLSPAISGDPVLWDSFLKLQQYRLADAKNQAMQALRNTYEQTAQSLAAQALQQPDDVKQTVRGPDSKALAGQLMSMAASAAMAFM